MLPDHDAESRERAFLALGLDHHVRLPAVEYPEKRVPVTGVRGVGVRPGLLLWVLAGQVDFGTRSSPLPRRQRQVEGLLRRQTARVQVVVECVCDGGAPRAPATSTASA